MKDTLLWGGTHRGALAIARQLTPETLNLYAPTVLLADPKANRAQQFGEFLRKQFVTLTTQPLRMRVQDALVEISGLDAIVLSVDTPDDIIITLIARRASERVTFQLCARGPGGAAGTRIGLQGTLTPGDEESQRSVSLLLPALSEMSRAASSRELTGADPVAAAVLQPLREVVSRQTAAHLAEKAYEPRDLTGSPLSVTFGQTLLPLLAVHGGAQEKYSQQQALALEHAGTLSGSVVSTAGQSSRMVVVALVLPRANTIQFMRVALTRAGKRHIAGVTTFASSTESAVFTD